MFWVLLMLQKVITRIGAENVQRYVWRLGLAHVVINSYFYGLGMILDCAKKSSAVFIFCHIYWRGASKAKKGGGLCMISTWLG